MSSSKDMALVGVGEAARLAGGVARGTTLQDSKASRLRLAVVIDAGDGVYTVGLVGADASVVETIPGVPVWGSATFSPGDRVTVAYTGDRPIPYILSGGGSGGGSADVGIIGEMWFTS